MDKLKELEARLIEINDIESANGVLGWDQNTYMPPGGVAARGRQSATLAKLAHAKFTDPAIGKLLDDLLPYEQSLPYDSDEASLLRVTRRNYEKAVRVPPDFMAQLYNHLALSYDAWAKARPANAFAAVRPCLEKTLELSRQYAGFFPGYEHIADPLIDLADYGVKVSVLRPLFAQLRAQLVPIVQAITSQPPADDACLRKTFPEAPQLAFGLEIAQRFGYDLERGRLDKSPHPFTTSFSIGDVRITTTVKEDDLSNALYGIWHEAGHAMYEQGVSADLEGTPLARGASSGVHESQSRLWENIVGRGRSFCRFVYPRLQELFPAQLGQTPLETFYRAVNKVSRSLIRTDADEVTYNLHVVIRFELELELLEGQLAVRDLPEAWRERYRSDLGILPPDDRDGVLQDMHWYSGFIGGAFQGYTLGNILSAQFFEAALRAHPDIPAQIERGEFGVLHGWLKDNIYKHGAKFTASEIVQRAAGGPLSSEPYIRYLRSKYGELYALDTDCSQPDTL